MILSSHDGVGSLERLMEIRGRPFGRDIDMDKDGWMDG